ncbi:MAG: peptidoglycan editing factor PgeF [Candidatus Goldbacteria bacterium]|nr:peptidoglycan editing factor PgeF [Candidatus Goldiibacteriota bacterium]
MNKYKINLTPIFFKKEFIIAITTKKVKSKKQAEKVLKFKRINILKQIHSDRIIIVKKRKSLHNKKADGIITDLRNFPVAVKVADCIGSVIIEPDKKVLAVVHSGWRGIAKKIILRAIKIMKQKFGCNIDKMVVITSPSIGPCCYEIGRDLYNELSKHKLFDNIFSKRNGKIYMDLQKANKNLLIAVGIKRKNIYINKLCTKCNNDLFFSYRGEGKKTGRMYVVGCIK